MKLPNKQHHSSENGDGSDLPPPFRNPFVHELRFTPLEKIRIGVMTVTVFPVRLFFAVLLMLLAWPFAFAAALGRSELAVETETWWRRICDLPEGDHACHVVLWRVPLGDGERGTGPALAGAHPHPGPSLVLLRRHPRHHDHGLYRHEDREQEHPRLGHSDKVHKASVRVAVGPGFSQEDG